MKTGLRIGRAPTASCQERSASQNALWRFCALSYREMGADIATSDCLPVILLALRHDGGDLSFLIHPNVRNMFRGEDLEYLDSLIWDFVERARTSPNDLVRHLSTLSGLGPLVISEFGTDISKSSTALEIEREFVEL